MVLGSQLTFADVTAGDQVRLGVTGELDLATREVFISAALGALEAAASVLELDFAGVTFCDSSGVSGILAMHRIALDSGKRLILVNLQPQLVQTLTVAGLHDILTDAATEA